MSVINCRVMKCLYSTPIAEITHIPQTFCRIATEKQEFVTTRLSLKDCD